MTQSLKTKDGPVWQDGRAIALMMAATLMVMANATISPALAGLERAFMGQTNADFLIRLLVPAPSLTVVIFAPLAGYFVDRYGRRVMLLFGVVLFVITGSAGFYLPNLEMIFTSRLALGIAVAMIMTSQTALIGDYFTGEKRSALTGLQISARNFGGFVFLTLAGWFAVSSPRLPFVIYGLAVLYLPFMWMVIRETSGTPAKETIKNTAKNRVIESVIKTEASEADGHLSWKGWIAALAVLQLMTNMIFFLMPTQLPFFLDSLGYDSAVMTGAALGALSLAGGCAALFYSRIKRVLNYAGTYALGYGFMALGFAILPLGTDVIAIFAGSVAVGIGFALAVPNFVGIALQIAPSSRRGMAGGVLTTAVFLGQFCSPFLSIPSITSFGYNITYQGAALLLGTVALMAALKRGVEVLKLRMKEI
ncbi:MFS transporter [Kiloniella spongiae]|uniref:MFS transporter n=1 Tax=Kiloniella spongiae TaxID=1489064 RepID=A0A0H2MEQ8_9PROT|nr:MFS transporter [Kiloniella spongiae]KLN60989.1 MFS transporter [Kiloniella spongiae]